MANSQLLSGITSLAIDGSNYDVKEGISFRPCVVTRESVKTINGTVLFKETREAGQIKATFYMTNGVSVDSFNAMNNSDIVIISANGTVVIGNGMWSTETQTADVNEGTFEVTFEGPDVSSTTA